MSIRSMANVIGLADKKQAAGKGKLLLRVYRDRPQILNPNIVTNIRWNVVQHGPMDFLNIESGIITLPLAGEYTIMTGVTFGFGLRGLRNLNINTSLGGKWNQKGSIMDRYQPFLNEVWKGLLPAGALIAARMWQNSRAPIEVVLTNTHYGALFIWKK